MHPVSENLQQLSRLTNLESIHLHYQCDCASAIDDAADAWHSLPINFICLEPDEDELSANTFYQLGTLTKLTELALLPIAHGKLSTISPALCASSFNLENCLWMVRGIGRVLGKLQPTSLIQFLMLWVN